MVEAGFGRSTARWMRRVLMTSEVLAMIQATQDSEARRSVEELVQVGLPLVQYAVSDLAGRVPGHIRRDDLISAGMLGLAQAARSWDPTRGVTFERYARTRIGGALLDELRDRDWASRSVRSNARRLQAAADDLTARLGHPPDGAELGRAMGLTVDEVAKLQDDVHRATVLHFDTAMTDLDGERGVVTDGDATLDHLLHRELTAYLRDAVRALPERLRKVVVEYFFEERQMQDIAAELGVTESRVSQMRGEAVALLREGIDAQLDPERVTAAGPPKGRVATRKAAYFAEVAAASDFRTRLSTPDSPVAPRAAAATA